MIVYIIITIIRMSDNFLHHFVSVPYIVHILDSKCCIKNNTMANQKNIDTLSLNNIVGLTFTLTDLFRDLFFNLFLFTLT